MILRSVKLHTGSSVKVNSGEDIHHHSLLLSGIRRSIAQADVAVGAQDVQRFDHLLGVQVLLRADLLFSGGLDKRMELFGEKPHLSEHGVPDQTVADVEKDRKNNADNRGIERGTDAAQKHFDTVHGRFRRAELYGTDTHDQSEEGT